MNLHDILRSLFGFPGHNNPDEIFRTHPGHCDGCNEESGPHRDEWGFSFGNLDDLFRHFHGDFDNQMETMQREMDEMMKGFGQGFVIEGPSADHPKSPRDEMLKHPENSPHNDNSQFFRPRHTPYSSGRKADEEIVDVDTNELVRLYDQSQDDARNYFQPSKPYGHYSRVSVRRVQRPDGSVHEERTVCDGEGNCETTVTDSSSPSEPRDGYFLGAPSDGDRGPGMFGNWIKIWPWNSRSPNVHRPKKDDIDESLFDKIFNDKEP